MFKKLVEEAGKEVAVNVGFGGFTVFIAFCVGAWIGSIAQERDEARRDAARARADKAEAERRAAPVAEPVAEKKEKKSA